MNDATKPVAPDRIGRRANARVRLGIPGKMLLLGSNAHCQVDNLSCSGARLTMAEPPRPGESAILQCEVLDAFCTVVRVDGRTCAVVFVPPLDQQSVRAMRSTADHFADQWRKSIERRAQDWISGSSRN